MLLSDRYAETKRSFRRLTLLKAQESEAMPRRRVLMCMTACPTRGHTHGKEGLPHLVLSDDLFLLEPAGTEVPLLVQPAGSGSKSCQT